MGFPCGSADKESTHNAGDLGLIPGLGRSPGEGKGYPLQYSGLENSMDYTVYEVAESQTQLSDFHFKQNHHPDGGGSQPGTAGSQGAEDPNKTDGDQVRQGWAHKKWLESWL